MEGLRDKCRTFNGYSVWCLKLSSLSVSLVLYVIVHVATSIILLVVGFEENLGITNSFKFLARPYYFSTVFSPENCHSRKHMNDCDD